MKEKIEKKMKELEVTKDTNSDDYWKGVLVGLNIALKILNNNPEPISNT